MEAYTYLSGRFSSIFRKVPAVLKRTYCRDSWSTEHLLSNKPECLLISELPKTMRGRKHFTNSSRMQPSLFLDVSHNGACIAKRPQCEARIVQVFSIRMRDHEGSISGSRRGDQSESPRWTVCNALGRFPSFARSNRRDRSAKQSRVLHCHRYEPALCCERFAYGSGVRDIAPANDRSACPGRCDD